MSLSIDTSLWSAIEQFYRREVMLLQDRRYREWLALMDPFITYRVPVTTSTMSGLVTDENELGYYDEDAELLEARVAKLESKQSWVENPPSRLRYFIQLIDVTQNPDQTITARSNLLLWQYRWNMEQHFSGERTDILQPADSSFKICKRRVVLDRQAMGNQGLSVFF